MLLDKCALQVTYDQLKDAHILYSQVVYVICKTVS